MLGLRNYQSYCLNNQLVVEFICNVISRSCIIRDTALKMLEPYLNRKKAGNQVSMRLNYVKIFCVVIIVSVLCPVTTVRGWGH